MREDAARGEDSRAGAFCSLSTTGPDPAVDLVLRVRATRVAEDGSGWDELDLVCGPPRGAELPPGAVEHAARLGLSAEALAAAPDPPAVWRELRAFLGARPVVVPDAESFAAFGAHLAGTAEGVPCVLGIDELGRLLAPGRRPRTSGGDAPHELQHALTRLVEAHSVSDPTARELAASGYAAVVHGIAAEDRGAAERLAAALELAGVREALGASPEERSERAAGLAADLGPVWAERAPGADRPPLPPDAEGPLEFPAEDLARLDEVFLVHLPAVLGLPPEDAYRESQHQVAREVARTFGAPEGELLLVHAPTGTGKTLAYLVPAVTWARRHGVRVGIATYTRALQEQAMEREVPRALAALERAGLERGTVVSTLKGRENYLCWRALERSVPDAHAGWEEWLAWTQLALFARTEATGDLDRFPLRAPLRLESSARYERVLSELVRQVRARSSCCTHEADRATCGAEVARRRAERSHVVVTNHSFALARQDFFRHMVFDECEHLHDQAHAAWSHSVAQRRLRDLLDGLHGGRAGRGAGLFERIERRLVAASRSHDELAQCVALHDEAVRAFGALALELDSFLRWRSEAARGLGERDAHGLLREYAEGSDGAGLVDARVQLSDALTRMETGMAALSERLGNLAARSFARTRRQLDLARADLEEVQEGLGAWIPLEAGAARFGRQTFHDVQVDARGEVTLVARVLLPNEFLGRHYHPRLATGAFLSATACLQNGFDSALGYLGLDRAAEPAPEEERPASRVRTFRAPEVFDYGRALVAVPRDAPGVGLDKEEFLTYVGGFLARLGERTRGRILGLFTNADDLRRVGARLEGFFRARRIPFWYQNMKGTSKEELGELFRCRGDSILLGVDTFWYGADFPGETLEYLVLVKLPYGVPDGYHHAQCAALGTGEQRRRIYLPRALSKFRQGFGRLMRTVHDRGCVFVLDRRILEPRHRHFLRELPLRDELDPGSPGARLVRGDTEHCVEEALGFMGREQGPAAVDPGASSPRADRSAQAGNA